MALKISASVLRAAICSPPGRESGKVGDGMDNVWMRSVAAMAVASVEDRFGISLSCGKKSTVREVRSARVLGM